MVISPIIKILNSTELVEGSASNKLFLITCHPLPVRLSLSLSGFYIEREEILNKHIILNIETKQYSFTSLYFNLKQK